MEPLTSGIRPVSQPHEPSALLDGSALLKVLLTAYSAPDPACIIGNRNLPLGLFFWPNLPLLRVEHVSSEVFVIRELYVY